MKEYAVEIVKEGALGTLLLGSSKLSKEKLEQVLNERALKGWNMDFMLMEQRRLFLFWQREVAIITFSKVRSAMISQS